MSWLYYGLFSIVISTSMIILYKHIALKLMWKPILVNVFMILTLLTLIYIVFKKDAYLINIKNPENLCLIALVLFLLLQYYYAYGAVAIAPNPGYPCVILASSCIFVILLSNVLFKSHLNRYTLLFSLITIIGIYIIIKK